MEEVDDCDIFCFKVVVAPPFSIEAFAERFVGDMVVYERAGSSSVEFVPCRPCPSDY